MDEATKLKYKFDWRFYVSYNSDLTNVSSKKEAWNHFIEYGFNENRYYSKDLIKEEMLKIGFDWKFYVYYNIDL